MATTDNASLVIALAAIAVAVMTATFQILEMRRQTSRAEAQLASYADEGLEKSLRHLSSVFLTYPELRPIFQPSEFAPAPEGKDIDFETRLRAETICEDLMDTFERVYTNAEDRRFPWEGEIWNYYAQLMVKSDFLFEYVSAHKDWWKPDLMDRALAARES